MVGVTEVLDGPVIADIAAEKSVLGACMASATATQEIAERLSGPEDFARPAHQTIFFALLELAVHGRSTDPITLRDHLEAKGEIRRCGGAPYLLELQASLITIAQAIDHADIVAERAERRRAEAAAQSFLAAVRDPQATTTDAVERLSAQLARIRRPSGTGRVQVCGLELREFLDNVPPDPEWLVPGLLERGDRLILTGPEGGGKSTLLRQLGVQLASGIHPFGGAPFPPVRVLIFDLENSPRQVYPKLSGLLAAAGTAYAGGLTVAIRGEGLDLTQGDGELLDAEVQHAKPDVLITGPAYKMVAGDPTEEGPARLVAAHLDRLRIRYGCAVLLEAHTPHASNGGKRPTRPYGASLWLRWPEFGLHLGENGALTHWRGARDERDWPAMLQRGGPWPWSPVTRPRDVLWAQILDYCTQAGERLSMRDLAQMTGSSYGSVNRAVEEHRAEWDALGGDS